jgi:hypothetical protein
VGGFLFKMGKYGHAMLWLSENENAKKPIPESENLLPEMRLPFVSRLMSSIKQRSIFTLMRS